jgi:hypothetical protein
LPAQASTNCPRAASSGSQASGTRVPREIAAAEHHRRNPGRRGDLMGHPQRRRRFDQRYDDVVRQPQDLAHDRDLARALRHRQ